MQIGSLLPYVAVAGVVIAIVLIRTYGWSSVSQVSRGLVCPNCDSLALEITHQLTIDDEAWDAAALQAAQCSSCGFTAAATYQESRRGAATRDVVHHTAVAVTKTAYGELAAALDAENADQARRLIDAAHATGAPFEIQFRVDRRKSKGT